MKKLVPALVVAGLIFAGCGGSSGGESGSDDEAQVRDLVEKSADVLQEKDYQGYCDLLSPDTLEQLESAEGFGDSDCESLMAVAGAMATDEDIESLRDPESVTVDGDRATVTFADEETETLYAEKVDGEWKIGTGESGGADTSEDESSS